MRDSVCLQSTTGRNAGFSLIELTMVMGITCVIIVGSFAMFGERAENSRQIEANEKPIVEDHQSYTQHQRPAPAAPAPINRDINNLDVF